MYALTGTFRFHRGWIGAALWGVWQKMQICCSLVDLIGPGPETDRLCLVPTMLADWARTGETRKRIKNRGLRIDFMARPPQYDRTPRSAGCTNRRSRCDYSDR